ncbi:hypothetical protein FNV43_RR00914 [Rhamnella rubrinervis]|uniref:Uncharacterized protein n=1 Tax=Rhamnella rubrinervis TaxID=2594499 RepID=A0A8K0HQ10_9ROSA|nr:hypothetical protein FNV43_RR00914 [Rhamnella rubrinervis]
MDTRFYVVREERRRVIVRRHVAPHLQDPLRVLVMEPSAENFHVNMAARHQDHDDTSYGGGWPTVNVVKAGPGKQLPVLQAPAKVIDSNEAARIYGGVVIKGQALPHVPAPGKVIDSNEAARIYGGVVIRGRVF